MEQLSDPVHGYPASYLFLFEFCLLLVGDNFMAGRIPNMFVKEASLSRYEAFKAYKATSYFFIPGVY